MNRGTARITKGSHPHGTKRRFAIAGALNALLTNLTLQTLLLIQSLPSSACTMLSQFMNATIGYTIYGRWVFRVNSSMRLNALRYLALQTNLWLLNWMIISLGEQLRLPRNDAALAGILPLAVTSFIAQKNWVFRKK